MINTRLIGIIAAGLIVAALLVWLLISARPSPPALEAPSAPRVLPTATPAPPQRITLLFPGSDDLLHPEIRTVPLPDQTAERIRVVFAELAAGPGNKSLAPALPYAAELRTVYIGADGNAYLDLTAPPEPLQGSSTELMMVYSVVDSILLNTEITAVQLLFDGSERQTLTGHLDIGRPLVLNKRFIAAS